MNRTFKQMALLFFAALLFAQCNQPDAKSLRIRGKLTGVKDSILFSITAIEKGEAVFRDTTVNTNNGEFDFTMSLDSVCSMEVVDGASDRENRYVGFYTLAVPGEEMVLEGDINKGWRFSGSTFYRDFNEVEQAIQPINLEMRSFAASFDSILQANKLTAEAEMQYSKHGLDLYRKLEKAAFAFAKSHPDMEASVGLISYLDIDSAKKLVKLLKPSVLDGRMKAFVDPRINLPSMQPVPYNK